MSTLGSSNRFFSGLFVVLIGLDTRFCHSFEIPKAFFHSHDRVLPVGRSRILNFLEPSAGTFP